MTRGLVELAAVLLVVGALRLTAPVSLPLAFALFVIALATPLERMLARVLPRWLAALCTFSAFLGILAALLWALGLAAEQMAYAAIAYQDRYFSLERAVVGWLVDHNLPTPTTSALPVEAIAEQAQATVNRLSSAVAGVVLILAFLALGLAEVHELRRKVWAVDPRLGPILSRVARDLQRYMVVRTGIGLLTGVLVGLGTWVYGLQLPFLWGVTTFLLNYIPTVGSIVAIVPPVVFAYLQFGTPGAALGALGLVGAVQLVVGNGIDPMVQGRYLQLSPLVVLTSVAFWGWVWGVPGAFLGVPITIGVVRLTSEFDRTRWVSVVLAGQCAAPVGGADAGSEASEP